MPKNMKGIVMTAWIYLIIAIVFEITWAVALKYSASFTKLIPSAVTISAMIGSVIFLALAVKEIPIGTAYAIWTGAGAAGVAVLGIILFKEPVFAARIAFLFLIISGVAGLKIVS